MKKYRVMYDLGENKRNWKEIKDIAGTAQEIYDISVAMASNTYMVLCVYAEKFVFEYNEYTEVGSYYNDGILNLIDMGYIEIGEPIDGDDFKTIWIIK